MNRSEKKSLSLVKYDFFSQPVRFSANRKKANRLVRVLKNSLEDSKALQTIHEVRDRIYFRTAKNPAGPAPRSSIALSGLVGGEGTTTVSLLLSLSLGDFNRSKILFVDGRLDRQNFVTYRELFGLTKNSFQYNNGFGYLQCYTARNRNLFFLGSQTSIEPIEFFFNPELKNLLSELKESFDHIIFDMPPVLNSSETRLLFNKVDFFYLVCVPLKTLIADIERCKKLVSEAGGTLSGVILNRQQVPFWTRFFGREAFL